jgi:hypothetical protein
MGEWLIGSIITGIVVTLGWFFFTEMLPRMAADRASRPPEQSLTTLPGDEHQQVLAPDAETAIASTKMTHDVFLREADDLMLQARGAGLFTDNLLAEAAEKVNDAVKLRPGSFDANLMAGEIAVKRAGLAQGRDAVELLAQAAVSFATAAESKKGVIDTYVGRAWAHLERAHLLDGDKAAAAYLDASEVFLKGFRVSPQNLFILRGWGLAIDGLARVLGDDADSVLAAEEGYRLALAEHRSGDHELHQWYAEIREADEPVRMPMPAVRDRY